MGQCVYCGKPAGIFRTKHSACEQTHIAAQARISKGQLLIERCAVEAISSSGDFSDLRRAISEIEKDYGIDPQARSGILIAAWTAALDNCLKDDLLEESEENRLREFAGYFSLAQSDLDAYGAFSRAVKATVLRDVMNGIVPQRIDFGTQIPINLQKNELLVWVFLSAKYGEVKTVRRHQGGSQGVSVRLAKGIYYRLGAYKGETIESEEFRLIGEGIIFITSKHIYFYNGTKTVRVPYSKILSFTPFSDGFGIVKDTVTVKQQIFIVDDGWFSYNLVSNLARI